MMNRNLNNIIFPQTTAGHYVYIETSSPRDVGEKARLTSPTIQVVTNETKCFRLFYHMYGDAIGSLKVYVIKVTEPLGSPLFSIMGIQGTDWALGQVMNIHVNLKIYFVNPIDTNLPAYGNVRVNLDTA